MQEQVVTPVRSLLDPDIETPQLKATRPTKNYLADALEDDWPKTPVAGAAETTGPVTATSQEASVLNKILSAAEQRNPTNTWLWVIIGVIIVTPIVFALWVFCSVSFGTRPTAAKDASVLGSVAAGLAMCARGAADFATFVTVAASTTAERGGELFAMLTAPAASSPAQPTTKAASVSAEHEEQFMEVEEQEGQAASGPPLGGGRAGEPEDGFQEAEEQAAPSSSPSAAAASLGEQEGFVDPQPQSQAEDVPKASEPQPQVAAAEEEEEAPAAAPAPAGKKDTGHGRKKDKRWRMFDK